MDLVQLTRNHPPPPAPLMWTMFCFHHCFIVFSQFLEIIFTLKVKQDGIHCQRPTPPPPRRFLYLRETKLWRCGRGGREEKVHLKTHAPLGGGVGKNYVKSGLGPKPPPHCGLNPSNFFVFFLNFPYPLLVNIFIFSHLWDNLSPL